MSDLIDIMIYPVQQLVLLLFSLSFDGLSIGALIIAASVLIIVYRVLVGRHLSSVLPDNLYRWVDRSQRKDKDKPR